MAISKYLISKKELRSKPSNCELCDIKIDLQLHHIDYDNKWNVLILCRKCHRYLHRKENLQEEKNVRGKGKKD